MLSVLPSLIVLGLAAIAALHLAQSRSSLAELQSERRDASQALAVAVTAQGIHFAEEAATGFHERFGEVFGLPDMPFLPFVLFNVTLLVVWVASVWGVRSARTTAFFAAWFLAIGAMINLIAHPLLAVAVGGYFPGLASSPVIGVAGVWLWRRLLRATRLRSAIAL